MKYFEIPGGLDLALAGAPQQEIFAPKTEIRHLAVTGPDYVGMKPTLLVEEGERVLAGTPLFEDKKNPGVLFTSPGAGVVQLIHRGAKRAFRSVMIKLDAGDSSYASKEFDKYREDELEQLCSNRVRRQLVESGLWTALRTRPFSRIPRIDSTPSSLFVTAIDTNPHAPDPNLVIARRSDDFINGLKVLGAICGQKIWLCVAPGSELTGLELGKVEVVAFGGDHPAGLAGTHIHHLDPVGLGKTVWSIGYQDVIAIGSLFTNGGYPAQRVVALSGPMVKEPRLIETRVGACLYELTQGELKKGESRIISGSVLCGRMVEGNGLCCLGPYVNQVSVIGDGCPRDLFGWGLPGWRKFSLAGTVASRYLPRFPFRMTTALHGGHRAVFPNDMFQKLMPLGMEPLFLFRAIEMQDIESAEKLGALELDEEDVALCTLVDFGKNDYTTTLRTMLDIMMKEEE